MIGLAGGKRQEADRKMVNYKLRDRVFRPSALLG